MCIVGEYSAEEEVNGQRGMLRGLGLRVKRFNDRANYSGNIAYTARDVLHHQSKYVITVVWSTYFLERFVVP